MMCKDRRQPDCVADDMVIRKQALFQPSDKYGLFLPAQDAADSCLSSSVPHNLRCFVLCVQDHTQLKSEEDEPPSLSPFVSR